MVTDGGGWTVFQQRKRKLRGKGFQRPWTGCKNGFGRTGSAQRGYWIGLDDLNSLTSNGRYTLRVDLNTTNEAGYAIYSNFSVGDESTGYQLKLNYSRGTIGDSMTENNGMKFSTSDRDNDNNSAYNMAIYTGGPWWHNSVLRSNLNSVYMSSTGYCNQYITWRTWKDPCVEAIIFSEMKLRRDV